MRNNANFKVEMKRNPHKMDQNTQDMLCCSYVGNITASYLMNGTSMKLVDVGLGRLGARRAENAKANRVKEVKEDEVHTK